MPAPQRPPPVAPPSACHSGPGAAKLLRISSGAAKPLAVMAGLVPATHGFAACADCGEACIDFDPPRDTGEAGASRPGRGWPGLIRGSGPRPAMTRRGLTQLRLPRSRFAHRWPSTAPSSPRPRVRAKRGPRTSLTRRSMPLRFGAPGAGESEPSASCHALPSWHGWPAWSADQVRGGHDGERCRLRSGLRKRGGRGPVQASRIQGI